jgi:predicted enzyme related to lactoylglutathione lyase
MVAIAAIATACAGPTLQVPPLTPDPTGDYHTGKFVWYDLLTNDLAGVERFYGELFGWEFATDEDSVYTVITNGGKPIGGIANTPKLRQPVNSSQWVSWISVPDIDGAVLELQDMGGVVHAGPQDLLERGRVAVVSDPQEALFALVTASGGDPDDDVPPIGGWLWTELLTSDVDAALSFYAQMFDYEREEIDAGIPSEYLLLRRDGRPRAGVFENPFDGVRPHWLPYVRVDDPSALARRVEALGGRLIVEPQESIRGGRVAVIADPTGAVLAIQKWPPEG